MGANATCGGAGGGLVDGLFGNLGFLLLLLVIVIVFAIGGFF